MPMLPLLKADLTETLKAKKFYFENIQLNKFLCYDAVLMCVTGSKLSVSVRVEIYSFIIFYKPSVLIA